MTLNAAVMLLATATRYPDRIAVATEAAEISYADLAGYMRRVAGALRSQGIGSGASGYPHINIRESSRSSMSCPRPRRERLVRR